MSLLPLIDVHAHLQDDKFHEDCDEVVKRAVAAGVTHIINAGTSLTDSKKALDVARQHQCCLALVGVHPHDATTFDEHTLEQLTSLTADPNVLGIGEIGLDFHYDFSPRETQLRVFVELWQLAAKLRLPAVIHVREAYDSFFSAIEGLPAPKKVLLHCFSGDLEIAQIASEKGFHFSTGGALTYPKSEMTREVFKMLPLDRIHLETDCPYLAPQPRRGKRNEPSYLQFTLDFIAGLRNVPRDEMATILQRNAIDFFGERLA